MKKSFNVLLLFAFAMSLTVWSCKPKQIINETAEQAAEEVMQEVEEVTQAVEEAVAVEVEGEEEGEDVVEECDYATIEGKAVLTKFNFSNPNEVIIKFTFQPNDKDVSRFPEVTNEEIVFCIYGEKKYPSLDWCKKNGIETGASFDCIRYEVAEKDEADCEKVYFSLTEFEDSGL